MTLIAVYTTVANQEQARQLARALVERKLVACAQISEIESFYPWQGELQHDCEFRLLLKTTEARYPALEAAIRELHPYDLPAICALAFNQVSAPYADWVEASVA